MAFDSNPGSSRLGAVLAERMQKENASPQALDFGTVTMGGGLQTDTFGQVIPKGSYTVLRHLRAAEKHIVSELEEDGTVPPHEHTVTIPENILADGDRVLVAWVQNEAVVVDVIT